MGEPRHFTWWWPSSNAGNAAFWVILVLAGLTIFVDPFFFMINVVFWYLIAVGVRFVYLHATNKNPLSEPKERKGEKKNVKIASWILRILAAAIFLFPVGAIPKLMGNPYAVELFNQLGAGSAGRYAVASMELIAVILLLIPKTGLYGGLLGVLIMLGAIAGHLTKLGVVVHFVNVPGASVDNPEANPMLFILAVANLVLCAGVVYLNRGALPFGKSSSAPTAAAT